MKLRSKRLLAYLNLVLVGVLLALMGYILFWPIDVLKDWTLKMPGTSFEAGQEVTIESKYSKVEAVSGTSRRYLECNDRNGVQVRYPLNEAVADRKPGTGRGTGVKVTLPTDIPDLPTTCRVSISIDYRINLLKTHTEYNETDDFELKPAKKEAVASTSRSVQAPVAGVPVSRSASSSTAAAASPAPVTATSSADEPATSDGMAAQSRQADQPVEERGLLDVILEQVLGVFR